MSLVVIGHTGFIGKEICKILNNQNQKYIGISTKEINLLFKKNIKSLSKFFNKDTKVIFCSGIKRQLGDNLINFKKNNDLIINFIEACKINPPKSIIFLSSAAVYGEEEIFKEKITEKSNIRTNSFYGLSKFCCEQFLTKFCDENKIILTILRPPLLYGIGDTSQGYGPTQFCFKASQKQEIVLWGDGCELREFIFVNDLAEIVILMLKNEKSCLLNTVSGISKSFRSIIKILQKLETDELDVIYKERTKMKTDHIFDNSSLVKHLPNFVFTDINNGIYTLYNEILSKRGNYECQIR